MPPSTLPDGRQPPSNFGSVDWLSQSSCSGSTLTSKPSQVSSRRLPGRGQECVIREPPQTTGTRKDKRAEHPVSEPPVTGLSKKLDPARHPRIRSVFTLEQLSTLEVAFQQHQYLSRLERRNLALEVQLSEEQIKTWFQNRRVKHRRQVQDPQCAIPRPPYTPLASPAPASGPSLQLYEPQALVLPPGSFRGLCQVKQPPLAPVWAPCQGQPLTCHPPDSRSHMHTRGPWSLCALLETNEEAL